MGNRWMLYLFFALFLFSFIYIFKRELDWRKKEAQMNHLFFSVNNYITEQIECSDKAIHEVDMKGSSGTIKMSEILNEEKLIVYLPDLDCHSCTAKEVEVIKHIFPFDERSKIVVIACIDNRREIKLFENFSGLKTLGISKNDTLLQKPMLRPTLFLATPSMRSFAFFTPYSDTPGLSTMYYQAVYSRFKKKRM